MHVVRLNNTQRRPTIVGTCAMLAIFIATTSVVGQSLAPPPESLHDAELTSITFADVDAGWCVGDRGVIWHTIDAGRHWQRQDSPVRCRLQGVSFVDANTGWAVGGQYSSYMHRSEGVVLRTVDGGQTWQNVPGLQLPALKYVKFFDARRGVAVGDSAALFPSGVFTTADGGRSWATLPADRNQHWQCSDFSDVRRGIVAATSGSTASVGVALKAGGDITNGSSSTLRRPRAVRLSDKGPAWLCGEGGLLLASHDGGQSWALPTTFPAHVHFDFNAITTLANHVWLAGSPGSVVFHSADGGRTWEPSRTDSQVPLNHLHFIDENRGWAVGALGTILATRDGGRSWRVQRQAGTKAALLCLVSEPHRLPHELLVQQAGNEGYLTAAHVITRRHSVRGEFDSTADDRLSGATSTLLAAHADSAWQFPLSRLDDAATLEQLLTKWNGLHEGAALIVLEEQLVRQIRLWRPEVVVTEDVHPGGSNPLAHLMNQLVLAAVQKAADPAAYAEQHSQAALAAWKVKKVFAAITSEKQSDVKLVCSQLAPRIGASLGEIADDARSQLEATYTPGPAQRSFALLVDHLPQGQGRRDFFSGIALPPGGEARRVLSNPPNPDLASLTKQIQKRQMLQGLLQRSEEDSLRGTAWLAQITEMTRGLPPAVSARIMFYLAQRYEASGESDLAAEVMNTLAEKHADHPLGDAALLWLIRYYGSAEAGLQVKKTAAPLVEQAVALQADGSTKTTIRADSVSRSDRTSNRVALASGESQASVSPNAARAAQAVALGQLLEKRRPLLTAEPNVRFGLAHAARQQVGAATNNRAWQSLAACPSEAWSECAKAAMWIDTPNSIRPPKKVLACIGVAEKPVLDGRLDDAVWQLAKPVSLRESSHAGELLESIVAMLHDDEFLYIAISCQRAADHDYQPESRPRAHDADLAAHDRIELMLDIDRDYATSHGFAVDHRGWTSESTCGDPTWNPQWFVAAAGDDAVWTVEAAIPLAQLCPTNPTKNNYWAVGLQRVIPRSHLQGWSTPDDCAVAPENCGLLQFE